jgi:hypothetical protein
VHVPTDSVDSRELRASTPDLTPEQEQLLALVKQKYGIPDDMSIAEIVEASRRMLAMQAAKKPRARSIGRTIVDCVGCYVKRGESCQAWTESLPASPTTSCRGFSIP